MICEFTLPLFLLKIVVFFLVNLKTLFLEYLSRLLEAEVSTVRLRNLTSFKITRFTVNVGLKQEGIGIRRVIVLLLFLNLKASDPLIPSQFTPTNIVTNRTASTPYMRRDTLPLLLIEFPSIPGLLLVVETAKLLSVLLRRQLHISKALGKGPIIKVFKHYRGIGDSDVMGRRHKVSSGNSFSCNNYLARELRSYSGG